MQRVRLVIAGIVAVSLSVVPLAGQQAPVDSERHLAAAKAAAGQDYTVLYRLLCHGTLGRPSGAQAAPRTGPPPRTSWHAEPMKVFDNLYFVGMTEYSVWAVTTSDGIILLDTIYDYSVEDEVIGGLKTLGLDPGSIKYAIVSHAHSDHSGGAKFLQDRGVRILMAAADWDLLEKNTPPAARPKRDLIITDGQKLTLGDTTLTLHVTPGHTPGTVSSLIPVKDRGRPHTVAHWGGTGFNFTISPDKGKAYWFDSYINSAIRFKEAAKKAGADVLLSNHTEFDTSGQKMPALAKRAASAPHPFVVGPDMVQRYITVAEECAKASFGNMWVMR